MAAASISPRSIASMACPDPSAHQRNTKLQEQASTAALYVTSPERSLTSSHNTAPADRQPALSGHGKRTGEKGTKAEISAAATAANLKYARPQDLPGFPVVGIDSQSSGLTAATLATSKPKSIDPWKPTLSESAGKAALLATDYKMASSWQPEASAAGSRAALLAHKDGAKMNLWAPEASKNGNSAAGLALKKSLSPKLEQRSNDDGHKGALLAATGAVSSSRKRASSAPKPVPSYPDAANSRRNALNAATVANRPPKKEEEFTPPLPESLEAARVQNIGYNVPREMFTDAPPVDIEIDEKRRQDALRASAISMAKQMYEVQQAHINEVTTRLGGGQGHTAAVKVHQEHHPPMSAEQDLKQQAMQYIHLQEAAQKLAAERLAKIRTDDGAAFRDYYGYNQKQGRKRLSIKLPRRRGSDEDMIDSDDEEQSRRIRSQMLHFNEQVAQVDAKKRQKDREALLAAAQKNVQAQMHNMDEKVFSETGKAPPSMMEEWEAKAHARAAADSEVRMANHGKVHVGGGKYLDQAEIDSVAAARIKPTLDEINAKAEQQRAKDEERRLEEEERKHHTRLEKERETEMKLEEKRVKSEEKQTMKVRKAEERAAARAQKDAEKAKRSEERRIKKEDTRKSKDVDKELTTETIPNLPDSGTHNTHPAEQSTTVEPESTPIPHNITSPSRPDSTQKVSTSIPSTAAPVGDNMKSKPLAGSSPPMSPTKTESRGIKSFLGKFKRRSKQSKDIDTSNDPSSPNRSSFIGGAALTGARHPDHTSSPVAPPTASSSGRPSSFVRAGPVVPGIIRSTASPSISSLSSDEGAVSQPLNERRVSEISAPSPVPVSEDELEEARDTFDEKLVAPPKFVASEGRSSPVRETIFREELD